MNAERDHTSTNRTGIDDNHKMFRHRFSTQFVRRNRIRSLRTHLGRSTVDPTIARIEAKSSGKRRSDLKVHIALSLRNDGQIYELQRTCASRVHQLGCFHRHIVRVQGERLNHKIAGRRFVTGKVGKLELIVGSVVVQIDAILLTRPRVRQSRYILQQDPVSRIASIEEEASR